MRRLINRLYSITGKATDKYIHFLGGFLVAVGFMWCGQTMLRALWAAVILGAGKEVFDWIMHRLGRRGTCDFFDFLATAGGGFVAVLMQATIEGVDALAAIGLR